MNWTTLPPDHIREYKARCMRWVNAKVKADQTGRIHHRAWAWWLGRRVQNMMPQRRHTDLIDRRTAIWYRITLAVLAIFFASVFAIEASMEHDNINEKTEVGNE